MEGAAVRERAAELPREPGVYQFLEHAPGTAEDDVVIYVGKAVDLRDRVRSYVDPRSDRISRMIHRASAIDFAVTDTETQALLLEANLIKRHQPRYNVRLKDDKSYPMVELTDHEFPRIEITRDPDAGATVFGPFTDKGHLEAVVHAVRSVYGIRQCPDGRFYNRDRPCLDYQIGLCSGSCGGEISAEEYAKDVAQVGRFFEGETGVLADPLREGMEEAAAEADFERAANFRDRLEAVEALHGSGGAAVDAREDPEDARAIDVLGASLEGDRATVARLHAEDGKLIDRDQHTLSIPDVEAADVTPEEGVADGGAPVAAGSTGGDRSGNDRSEGGRPEDRLARVLGSFVQQYYADRTLPDRLLLSERLADPDVEAWLEGEGVSVSVPGAGREATLVDLALKNARRSHDTDEAGALRDSLSLSSRPTRIEGFDVSHAQGRDVVGSNVVFANGSPEKSEYRRKKLEETNDDYANMRDLLQWRAKRAVEDRDDRPDPDLLLIDGGEGQLDAARDALDECGWEVPAIALAKDEEIVLTPEGSHDWASDAPQLHLCQRVRDEAHRFAVRYHETLRDDVSTVLEEVSGVGPELRTRLLRRFGSVDGVRAASIEELRGVSGVGERTAETLRSRL
ncbi:excinuclease ABC subunit C [Halobacteriales archaeon QS_3_64_16]|nr:MAG: excinuclease ABC subunit C [Halobacteriales archaeon QS_3_64_16]